MVEVFLSLGSNIERERHIRSALAALRGLFGPIVVSSVYESEAVGFDGDPFFNLAVSFRTDVPLATLVKMLRDVEIAHGRTAESQKFAPRGLDIDLLLYGEQVVEQGGVKLPRAGIAEMAFVLAPLAEIAPDALHPILNQSMGELWACFDKQGIKQQRLENVL